jgi:hypothetical protein
MKFWEKQNRPSEIFWQKKFQETEMHTLIGMGEITGNNRFYSKAYPLQRPPLGPLPEGVGSGASPVASLSAS